MAGDDYIHRCTYEEVCTLVPRVEIFRRGRLFDDAYDYEVLSFHSTIDDEGHGKRKRPTIDGHSLIVFICVGIYRR